jgi:HEAT repeat protein
MARWLIGAVICFALTGCTTMTPEDEQNEAESDPMDAAFEKEFPNTPPTFLGDEIKQRVAALEYQSEEQLYSNLQRLVYIGEPAIPHILRGLESDSPRTRGSCAYILGLLRDRRTIKYLKQELDDPVAAVRYEVGTSLCIMGVREGYSVLIAGLSDEHIRNRYKAHEALRLLTRRDFGYRHDAEPSERRESVVQWEAWWREMEAAAL